MSPEEFRATINDPSKSHNGRMFYKQIPTLALTALGYTVANCS